VAECHPEPAAHDARVEQIASRISELEQRGGGAQNVEKLVIQHTEEMLRRVAGCLDTVVEGAIRKMVLPLVNAESERLRSDVLWEVAETVQKSLQVHSKVVQAQLEESETRVDAKTQQALREMDVKVTQSQRCNLDQQNETDHKLEALREEGRASKVELAAKFGERNATLTRTIDELDADALKMKEFAKQKMETLSEKLASHKRETAKHQEDQSLLSLMAEEGWKNTASSLGARMTEVAQENAKLKDLVLKSFKLEQDSQELLKGYVAKIASQVSSLMNYAMTIRLEENNKLIDATLRARVPDYVANASTAFALVRDSDLNSEAVLLAVQNPHLQQESMDQLIDRAHAAKANRSKK